MDFIINELERLLQILCAQKELYARLRHASPPGGLIRPVRRGRPTYMHSVPSGTYPNGKTRYRKTILEKGSPLLSQLALKEYLRVAQEILDHNIRTLERAKAGLLPLSYDAVRDLMRKPYHALPNELFQHIFLESHFSSCLQEGPEERPFHRQRQWATQPYEQSDYRPEEKIHITSQGLAVRSRAELLIAEMLYRYDIPFRYEQVLPIGKYALAPDFTFLDADGNEFYWEYCGMMAVPKYKERQLWRRRTYEGGGMTEWDNTMIYTYDASDRIDMREIEAVIKTKILPRMQGSGRTNLSA